MHALSPLHSGAGISTGHIDLPIVRSVSTEMPFIPSSTVKGVLRGRSDLFKCEDTNNKEKYLFGTAYDDDSGSKSGVLAFSDANLLVLPVKANPGVVAYVTCPFILHRFAREFNLHFDPIKFEKDALCSFDVDSIQLQNFELSAKTANQAKDIAKEISSRAFTQEIERKDFESRFLIVNDEYFSHFSKYCTEVRAHIAINKETGTVNKDLGALWYEESLPAESLLYGVIGVDIRAQAQGKVSINEATSTKRIQIGKNFTKGFGQVNIVLG